MTDENGNGHRRISDNDRIERLVENKWGKLSGQYLVPLLLGTITLLAGLSYRMIEAGVDDLKSSIAADAVVNKEQTKILSDVAVRLENHEGRIRNIEHLGRRVDRDNERPGVRQ